MSSPSRQAGAEEDARPERPAPPEALRSDPAADEIPNILRSAAEGDEDAWRTLVRLYAGRVFALVQSRCRRPDLAEEITQSVFVTLAAKLGSGGYAESGRFEAWLFRIALNRLRDHVRKHKRSARLFAADAGPEPAGEDAGAAPAAEGEEINALRTALSGLNDADRDVIELRHHAGMSFKDIAALRGEPIGTLLARHHRALRKLRQCMESGGRSPSGRTDAGATRPGRA